MAANTMKSRLDTHVHGNHVSDHCLWNRCSIRLQRSKKIRTACYITDPCPRDSCHGPELSCPGCSVFRATGQNLYPVWSKAEVLPHSMKILPPPNYAISCELLACSFWGEGCFRRKPSWLSVSPCQIDLEVVFSVPLHWFLSSFCDKYHEQKKKPVLAHSSREGVHIGEAPNVSWQCYVNLTQARVI